MKIDPGIDQRCHLWGENLNQKAVKISDQTA